MRTAGADGLKFLHKIGDGPSALQTGYGVRMAKACGFPAEIVARAEALQGTVRVCHPLLLAQPPADENITTAGQLMHYLILLGASSWQGPSLRKALSALRERTSSELETALLSQLRLAKETPPPSDPIDVSPQQNSTKDAGKGSKKRSLSFDTEDIGEDDAQTAKLAF